MTTRKRAEQLSSSHVRGEQRTNLVRLLAALLIVLPLVTLPFATRALIDRGASSLGAQLADALDRAFAWRHADEHDDRAHDPASLDLGLDLPHVPGLDVLQTPAEPPRETHDPARRGSSARSPALRGGIHVRAEIVARALQSGVVPSGVPVPARGPRPAGLALQGVGGFGAGLRDGDVLTRIGGAPATSVGVVVGVVAGALRHDAKVITGEVWRGEQRLSVAVEVPPIRRQGAQAPGRTRPKTRGPAKRAQGPNNPP
ncbi:hypothetical protein [Polyangium sorediatum]|uniref:PDZ domain-containing protein n=1 Tax=Polyangium sorediatum TaxID=889274 RepID=A0ABT6NV17_9BACT|nr:hypothetical protein [Polyangium sorediatum]MDI1432158.1 hypothetical protein [Polyangium sorediatum]